MYIFIILYFMLYLNILNIYMHVFVFIYIHNKHTLYTHTYIM